MTNPFPSQTQQAPPATISDAAAAEFGAQQSQNAFLAAQQAAAQQPAAAPQGQVPTQGFNPASNYSPEISVAQAQNGQHPLQQHGASVWTPEQHQAFAAQQAQQFASAAPAQPQGLPGQPWSPQQHQQNVPQAYTPQAPPAQQPPAAPQGLPQAPFPGGQPQFPGGGFPGAQAPAQGGGFIPEMFGAPSAGGGGTYPKVRDLDGRLCLFRVKKRDHEGTDYNDKTKKTINFVANVAVLDGGPLYSSPNAEDVMGQPELVSETVPYVIGDMIIGQVGLHNRLKSDFVRGRIIRHPKGTLEKQLMERYPGTLPPIALFTALQQGVVTLAMLTSGTYFWTILPDDSPQADQLVQQFAQNPVSRELML